MRIDLSQSQKTFVTTLYDTPKGNGNIVSNPNSKESSIWVLFAEVARCLQASLIDLVIACLNVDNDHLTNILFDLDILMNAIFVQLLCPTRNFFTA